MKHLTLSGSLAALFALCCSCSSPAATEIGLTSTDKAKATKTAPAAKKKVSFFPEAPSQSAKNGAVGRKKDKHGYANYPPSVRKRLVRTTAYSHMEKEPGAPGRLNASGTVLKYGSIIRSAAADWSLYPLGTRFKVKGLPYTFVVDDYGSALVGTNTVDLFFPTLGKMNKWGTREVEIDVIKWGSVKESFRFLKGRRKYRHCNRMYVNLKRNAPKFLAAAR